MKSIAGKKVKINALPETLPEKVSDGVVVKIAGRKVMPVEVMANGSVLAFDFDEVEVEADNMSSRGELTDADICDEVVDMMCLNCKDEKCPNYPATDTVADYHKLLECMRARLVAVLR